MPSRATETKPMSDERPQAARRERTIDTALQRRLQRARGLLHPEDHPRDHRDGEEREDSADELLGLEGQRVGAEGQDGADAERQDNGEADARPQPRQHVAPADARDIRDEDADDERGFEAFAQADEEGREHVNPSPGR